jgi:hypothetical protein
LIENYQGIAELITTVGGILGAFIALWWKITRTFAKAGCDIEGLKAGMDKMATTNLELTKALVQMAVKLDEREKDIMKLEGALDSQRKDMVQLIAGLQQATSSLDALWRTLQKLYPMEVPRRASDG